MKINKAFKSTHLVATVFMGIAGIAFAQTSLPDPDGKPADLKKPVKVFIVMGQSNTLEMGEVTGEKEGTLEKAIKGEGLYPFLVDDSGAWTVRKDVRNVGVMHNNDSANIYRNDWLTISGKKIGIEIGIGHQLGHAIAEPVMILKSSIGNRSLGWDLLPPGSIRYTHEGKEEAGYREYVSDDKKILPLEPGVSKVTGTRGANKGKQVDPWYAGKQYDDDIANAKKILSELNQYYPDANKYEVAGFFWWQGEKDAGSAAHAASYEKNLATLIKALRKEFNAPNAPFVMGTIGEVKKGATGNSGKILDAMLAVDGDSGKYPDFKGNVATVYTHPMSQGGSGNGHYSGNAKVYMDVGLAMGETMKKMLK